MIIQGNQRRPSILRSIEPRTDDSSNRARQHRADSRSKRPRVPRPVWLVVIVVSCVALVVSIGAHTSGSPTPTTRPGVVSTSSGRVRGQSTIQVHIPTGILTGNLLVAQLAWTGSQTGQLIAPPDWYLIRKDASPRGAVIQTLWYHRVTGSEPDAVQFGFPKPVNAALAIVNVVGARIGGPIGTTAGAGTDGRSVSIPPTTTSGGPSLLLAFASALSGAPKMSTAGDFSAGYASSAGENDVALSMSTNWTDDRSRTGGPVFSTDHGGANAIVGQVVALRQAQATNPDPSGTMSSTVNTSPTAAAIKAPSSELPGLSVSGNQIIDDSGTVIRLQGVNRSGTESGCIQGWGIFDGPSDAASINAIRSWNVNAVRIPLNEDCWLGINGVKPAYAGVAYQQAIVDYVSRLNKQGIYAILELHWSAPGNQPSVKQRPMPDRDHAIDFWSSVAITFKNNSGAVFDLFNEPYPGDGSDTAADWSCWSNGGECQGVSFETAGMQELLNAVRVSGARNLVLIGGINYAHDLSGWLKYQPFDPISNLAAAWHLYNFNSCNTVDCWEQSVAPVVAHVPVVAGEVGENDCSAQFVTQAMGWLSDHHQSYLDWTWDTWGANCASMSLVQDYSGTPTTSYGQGVHDFMMEHAYETNCGSTMIVERLHRRT